MGEPIYANEVRELHKRGWSRNAIANKVGINRKELARFINRGGLTPPDLS